MFINKFQYHGSVYLPLEVQFCPWKSHNFEIFQMTLKFLQRFTKFPKTKFMSDKEDKQVHSTAFKDWLKIFDKYLTFPWKYHCHITEDISQPEFHRMHENIMWTLKIIKVTHRNYPVYKMFYYNFQSPTKTIPYVPNTCEKQNSKTKFR